MSVYDKLEKWCDGTIRYVERDNKGRFKKVENKYDDSKTKFYQGQKVGVWNREPQQKIVLEINDKEYVKGDYYRASISLNVPLNGTRNKPNYKNFTYVVVDFKENIDMRDMYNKLIEEMEQKLHYKSADFWFDASYSDCDKQFPKTYSARSSSTTFEGTDY
jgi:hypothetical protein